MGLLEYLHELGFDDAARQLERRLGDQRPLSDYAQLYLAERALRLGHHGAARERLATLRGAYPDWSRVWRVSGEVEVWAGDLAAAVPYLESAIERSPDPDPRGRVRLAWLLEQQGRGDEAAAILAPLERQQRAAIDAGSESWGHPWALAAAALARGDRAAALDELERAYDTGLRQHLLLSTDPMLEPLRSEPRFADLIERMRADVERMRRRAAPVVAGLALPR